MIIRLAWAVSSGKESNLTFKPGRDVILWVRQLQAYANRAACRVYHRVHDRHACDMNAIHRCLRQDLGLRADKDLAQPRNGHNDFHS